MLEVRNASTSRPVPDHIVTHTVLVWCTMYFNPPRALATDSQAADTTVSETPTLGQLKIDGKKEASSSSCA